MSKILKIAITGVECSGKTSLTEALANLYNTTWVKEAARDYLNNLQRDYNLTDIDNILHLQLAAEKQTVANKLLFCDTDALVCKIWAEYKFGAASNFINNCWQTANYGLYLLCDFDIEWEEDPLREISNRSEREKIFFIYKNYLQQFNRNFVIIKGDLQQRIEQVQLLLKLNL